jgi:hypothetical protein
LLYYALGATLAYDMPVSRATMTIVQPRTNGDPIRTATVDAVELTEWSFELLDRARAALDPAAITVAGSWCKFCPAKSTCLSYQRENQTAAFREFTAFS